MKNKPKKTDLDVFFNDSTKTFRIKTKTTFLWIFTTWIELAYKNEFMKDMPIEFEKLNDAVDFIENICE